MVPQTWRWSATSPSIWSAKSATSDQSSAAASVPPGTRNTCWTLSAHCSQSRVNLDSLPWAGGHVGRASGRNFDARRDLAYAPYRGLGFEVPLYTAGDVDARLRVRIHETRASIAMIKTWLAGLPAGPITVPVPQASAPREGIAVVEAFRGDLLVWLRLAADGRVARCHVRDASWFQWPLLEAAIENNIVADFPLCNKSFNCSYSGHDLQPCARCS
jgi:Ni,Fe-hydrogenase III large subunit